tara:strand:+ start:1996 stop:3186 length:1191 start_codon:yes stop_codon:yes gene_type:complete
MRNNPYSLNTFSGGSQMSNSSTGDSSSSGGVSFGIVLDILLNETHPEYENYNKSQGLNGVFYTPYKNGAGDNETNNSFAYCDASFLKRIPVPGEIVVIERRPSVYTLTKNTPNDKTNINRSKEGLLTYWTGIVAGWNHPNVNVMPNEDNTGYIYGEDFDPEKIIAPLGAFPGDTIIEGRFGQSIRLNGTKAESNTIVVEDNNGKPTILISNGQAEPEDSINPVKEDINKDPSSIYLTSDHQIEIEPANDKREAYIEPPVTPEEYKGSQVIVNGGRLFFNAKDEGAFISAKESIGLNSNIVAVDGEEYVAFDADKIYLGEAAKRLEDEPVLLGKRTVDLLEEIIDELDTIYTNLATLPPAPPAGIAKLVVLGNMQKPSIPLLKTRLKRIMSEKVFTE